MKTLVDLFFRLLEVLVVIALVALLSTVLSALATGLVTDGISGLRALPFDQRTALRNDGKRRKIVVKVDVDGDGQYDDKDYIVQSRLFYNEPKTEKPAGS